MQPDYQRNVLGLILLAAHSGLASEKEGTIIWDRVENNLKVFTIKAKKWKIIKFSKEDLLNMYPLQAKHFYDCIYGNQKPLIDIKDAIQTQKVIDAAFKSSETEKFIKID